ncbi:hypothetical protein KSP40_PGU005356 [Platanthera guangdongensis]|uniref:Uncharacterized protein n=1 Tax=Platanthera guangdongensis TaxID=2320717 RepID=A0ABR2M0Y5_9ASPA
MILPSNSPFHSFAIFSSGKSPSYIPTPPTSPNPRSTASCRESHFPHLPLPQSTASSSISIHIPSSFLSIPSSCLTLTTLFEASPAASTRILFLRILDYLSQSADSDPSSPAEYLSTRSSRRTLIYLVLTLGHIYPDYDFSAVQAHLFFRVEEWDSFKQILDTYLFEAAKISFLLVSSPPPPPPTKKPIRLITSWYHLSERFLSSSSVEASIINLDSVGSRHLVRLHVSASRAQ